MFKRFGVETRLRRLGVEMIFRRLGLDTRLRRLGVETRFKRFGVERNPPIEDTYPEVPRPTTVDIKFADVRFPDPTAPNAVEKEDNEPLIEDMTVSVEAYPIVPNPATVETRDVFVKIVMPVIELTFKRNVLTV